MGSKAIFDRLVDALEVRNGKIASTLASHQAEVGRIKATYSERVAATKLADLSAQDREVVKAAHEAARSTAARCIDELRALLDQHICAVPDPAAMDLVRTAKSFGFQLSEIELRVLADAMRGNSVGLRCVGEIAKSSGFSLDVATPQDFTADLERIERGFSPSSWAPRDPALLGAALEILPNRVFRGVPQGRPDAVSISIAQGAADALREDLSKMAARWAVVGDPDASAVYSIDRLPSQAPQNAP